MAPEFFQGLLQSIQPFNLLAMAVGSLAGLIFGMVPGLTTTTATIVFLTELTSNTATTATFLPILAASAVGMGMSPIMLTIPATLGASCAFMLPVATPPNAIVFSSGRITIPQMCKAGLWLNAVGIVLIVSFMYAVIVPNLGVEIVAK